MTKRKRARDSASRRTRPLTPAERGTLEFIEPAFSGSQSILYSDTQYS